jgi:hypothetical protein
LQTEVPERANKDVDLKKRAGSLHLLGKGATGEEVDLTRTLDANNFLAEGAIGEEV